MWLRRMLERIEEPDHASVLRALQAVAGAPAEESIPPETAQQALAASELVAAGLGKPAAALPPEAQKAAEALRPRIKMLQGPAQAVVERLRKNPDLHDLWDEPDGATEVANADSREWRTQMDLLALRLSD